MHGKRAAERLAKCQLLQDRVNPFASNLALPSKHRNQGRTHEQFIPKEQCTFHRPRASTHRRSRSNRPRLRRPQDTLRLGWRDSHCDGPCGNLPHLQYHRR